MKKIIVYVICMASIPMIATAQVDNRLFEGAKTNNAQLVASSINPQTINMFDSYGNTALSYSLQNQNFAMVNYLLANGANPTLIDSTRSYIYCSGLISQDARIRYLFSRFNPQACGFVAGGMPEAGMQTVSSGFSWGTILGGAALVGGGIAIAAGGGGGDDAAIPGTGGATDSNYSKVGAVDADDLDRVLSTMDYNFADLNSGISNFDDYNEIRLAYSIARDYTGIVASYVSSGDNPSGNALVAGDKVKVAIVDSGVLTNHLELKNNIESNFNTNLAAIACNASDNLLGVCATNQGYTNDPNPLTVDAGNTDALAWHGTAVAGLVAAEYNNYGVTGVAPDAEIVPYKATFTDGFFVPRYYIGEAFKNAAEENVTVINNSYGIKSTSTLNAKTLLTEGDNASDYFIAYHSDIRNETASGDVYYTNPTTISGPSSNYVTQILNAVTNNDVVFVFSAGNEGTSQPSISAAVPLYFDEFINTETGGYKNFISVVNYDTSEEALAESSNQCGVTKDFCLAAPGQDLISTMFDDTDKDFLSGYEIVSGTSFSAPIVSGAVAVLKGAFPYLSGAEITELLFVTARDIGDPGVDEVYGWGMLDLERATRPVGVALVPVDDRIAGAGYTTASSSLKLSSNIANAIQSKNLQFVMLDSYNRTFAVNLNNMVQVSNKRIDAKKALHSFGANPLMKKSFGHNDSFSFTYTDNIMNNDTSELNEMEFSYKGNDEDYGFSLYYGNNPYNAFVDNKFDFYNDYTLANSFGYNVMNPYFTTNSSENFGINSSFNLSDDAVVYFGFLQQNYAFDDDNFDGNFIGEDIGSGMAFMGGMNHKINKNISAKFELGMINEDETLLGTDWGGAFGIGDDNITYMASMQSDVKMFDDKLSLVGKVNFGYTMVNAENSSLVNDMSNIYSQSFAMGASYNFAKENEGKHSLSFMISQPITIKSGNFDLSLPIARDDIGNMYYDSHNINLESEKEINYQLAYNRDINETLSFNAGAMYKDAIDDEFVLLLKFNKKL